MDTDVMMNVYSPSPTPSCDMPMTAGSVRTRPKLPINLSPATTRNVFESRESSLTPSSESLHQSENLVGVISALGSTDFISKYRL